MTSLKVGVIGCGSISSIYFQNLPRHPQLEVTACADLIKAKAESSAAEYHIRALTVDELLDDDGIALVVNLTIPAVHYEVAKRVLESGRHVYIEKPLSATCAEAKKLLELAEKKSLRIGCAPDTFLGGGLQTCRKLMDEGAIGKPIAATAYMMNHGHESWHPNPDFYYQPGGGPLFDMGPYYITALVHLAGPVIRVMGVAGTTFSERTITSSPKAGTRIKVNTPTHITSILEFKNGMTVNLVMSFDVWRHNHSAIEIYGTEGSLSVPDPNGFGGRVSICGPDKRGEFKEVRLTHGNQGKERGLGVADMADGLLKGFPHRANGEMAFHVLEVMESILIAAKEKQNVELASSCRRPDPLEGISG